MTSRKAGTGSTVARGPVATAQANRIEDRLRLHGFRDPFASERGAMKRLPVERMSNCAGDARNRRPPVPGQDAGRARPDACRMPGAAALPDIAEILPAPWPGRFGVLPTDARVPAAMRAWARLSKAVAREIHDTGRALLHDDRKRGERLSVNDRTTPHGRIRALTHDIGNNVFPVDTIHRICRAFASLDRRDPEIAGPIAFQDSLGHASHPVGRRLRPGARTTARFRNAARPHATRRCPASQSPGSCRPPRDNSGCQASATSAKSGPWAASSKRLRPRKGTFRGLLLALLVASPAWATQDVAGPAARGALIRCPDWERLVPPVVLAGASEGQTKQAFEARAGRPARRAAALRPSGSCHHVVAAGDTLGSIAAARLGTSRRWREIRAANPGVTPERLRIGETLKLPCTVADGAGEGGAEDPPGRTALVERLRGALGTPKAEAAAAPEAPAAESDTPGETPALPPPPVWTAAQGEFLADVLTRWGAAAGWTVIVDTTDAWRVAVAFETQAAFDGAVAELIRGMGHDGTPPRVRLYPNQVLRLGGPL